MRKVMIDEMKVKDGTLSTVEKEIKNGRTEEDLGGTLTKDKYNGENNSSGYNVSGVGGYGLNII